MIWKAELIDFNPFHDKKCPTGDSHRSADKGRPGLSSDTEPTPLEQIEQRVQMRAKEIALDLSGSRADKILRQFVTEEIRDWNDDYRVGARAHPLSDPDLVAERAIRNLTGYGPLAPLLADDDVWEVIIESFMTSHY